MNKHVNQKEKCEPIYEDARVHLDNVIIEPVFNGSEFLPENEEIDLRKLGPLLSEEDRTIYKRNFKFLRSTLKYQNKYGILNGINTLPPNMGIPTIAQMNVTMVANGLQPMSDEINEYTKVNTKVETIVRNTTNVVIVCIDEEHVGLMSNDEYNQIIQNVTDKNYEKYGMTENIYVLTVKDNKWVLKDMLNFVTYDEIPYVPIPENTSTTTSTKESNTTNTTNNTNTVRYDNYKKN
jgi:hypothetical protein